MGVPEVWRPVASRLGLESGAWAAVPGGGGHQERAILSQVGACLRGWTVKRTAQKRKTNAVLQDTERGEVTAVSRQPPGSGPATLQRDLGTPPVEGGSRSPASLRGQQLQGQERPHVSAHLPAISRQSPNRAEEEEPSEAPTWGQPPAAAPRRCPPLPRRCPAEGR